MCHHTCAVPTLIDPRGQYDVCLLMFMLHAANRIFWHSLNFKITLIVRGGGATVVYMLLTGPRG